MVPATPRRYQPLLVCFAQSNSSNRSLHGIEVRRLEVRVMGSDTGQDLSGAKVAVLVENKFIPEEISAYQTGFAMLGADLEFVSRIWYEPEHKPPSTTFYSDLDPLDNEVWESPQKVKVSRDISTVEPDGYAAVIMSANYTSVRLRQPKQATPDLRAYVQSAPVVEWYAKAMNNHQVIKGALCHGLWILTPNPELLRGRKVVCNPVVLADVLNCGAEITLDPKVVVDRDLVTGYSKHEVVPFIEAIARQIRAVREHGRL
jgi:protease I